MWRDAMEYISEKLIPLKLAIFYGRENMVKQIKVRQSSGKRAF